MKRLNIIVKIHINIKPIMNHGLNFVKLRDKVIEN